tara:strand:- start:26706 stop:27410 length:705 start_codon:yes stop_codon:yes gene_type:complete
MVGLLLVTFQNCSQGRDDRSMEYVVKKENNNPTLVADEDITDNLAGLPTGNGSLGGTSKDPLALLDSVSCFQNYISVFEWKNPGANLMSEKPVLGSKKMADLKLKDSSFSEANLSTAWRIEGMIKIAKDGSSSSAIQFLKSQVDSSDSLDCYLMRVGDNETLQAGLANVLFHDIGNDLNANIFIGFLRYQEQFIACRVSSGSRDVELKNDGEVSTMLSSSQAFVLKRGCYPSVD